MVLQLEKASGDRGQRVAGLGARIPIRPSQCAAHDAASREGLWCKNMLR